MSSSGVSISAARFLNPDHGSRAEKRAFSVVVNVDPTDAQILLPSLYLFGGSRKVEKRIPPPQSPNTGTAGTLAMSSSGAESPTPSALSARSTTAGLNTDAPIPPAQKGVTYDQSSTAASPPPRSAPIARAITLPPSANVPHALPHHPLGPLPPPGRLPQTPLYSHPQTWIWTTCPESARRQH